MASKDEQIPPRRSTKTRAETINLGKQDPTPLIYPSVGEKSPSPRPTVRFRLDEERADSPRTNTSVVRYSPAFLTPRTPQRIMAPLPPRHQNLMTRQLQPRPTRKIVQEPVRPSTLHTLKNMHWLFLIGLAMMVALILWMMGTAVLAWGIQRYYDFRYGVPRTYQVDQVVGQGGDSPNHPSHFMALNVNHLAVVIELRASNPAKSVSYTVPISHDNGEAPITLEFRDVTGDGKLDMIMHLHLLRQEQIVVFLNDGDQFRLAHSSDHVKL